MEVPSFPASSRLAMKRFGEAEADCAHVLCPRAVIQTYRVDLLGLRPLQPKRECIYT
jgi:hypothetical protein